MPKKSNDSLFWGVVMLAIGMVFLLWSFDVPIDFSKILKLWPLILVYFGGKAIYDSIQSDKGTKAPSKTEEPAPEVLDKALDLHEGSASDSSEEVR